jgi:hypothetical protein
VLWFAPSYAALLIAIVPPERDDLLDLADEADVVDQARIEQALYDATMDRTGLRLLEEEIRDRQDRRFLRERARAVIAGLELSISRGEEGATQHYDFAIVGLIGVSFDLLVAEIPVGPIAAPAAEVVRIHHCEVLAQVRIDSSDTDAMSVLRTIEEEHLGRALGCEWSLEEPVEVAWLQ